MEVEEASCKESENEMSEMAMGMGEEGVVEAGDSRELLCKLLDRGILLHKDPLTCRC